MASRPLAASPDDAQVDLFGEELLQPRAHDGVVVDDADFDNGIIHEGVTVPPQRECAL